MSEAVTQTTSVFRHRAFALYWFSRIASILSFHMLVVAVGWQLYELTGSAFDLGLLGLAQFGPMLVLTLYVGLVAVGIGLACGISIGAIAAYAGSWVSELLMRTIDILYTFPDVLIALGLVAFLGPSLTNAMVAVGISVVPYYARVTYAIVLAERQKTYVDAAHVIGAGHAEHDLSALVGHRLRSHGGGAERTVPFLLSHPVDAGYRARAQSQTLRNFDIFDYALNANLMTDFRFGFLAYHVSENKIDAGTTPALNDGIPNLNTGTFSTSGSPTSSLTHVSIAQIQST